MHFAPVLIVDDNASTLDILEARFQNKSIPSVTASDGFSAMEMLELRRFSLVLLDIVMPGMDGLELIRWMTRSGVKTPVVAMSGIEMFDGVNCAHLAQELGAFWGIAKPVTDSDIEEMESLRVPILAGAPSLKHR